MEYDGDWADSQSSDDPVANAQAVPTSLPTMAPSIQEGFQNRFPRVMAQASSPVDDPAMIAAIQVGTLPTQYAVGWFTLALINAGLAQGKGRSGLAWWALSLLLGPLATLLIVLLDPLKPR